MTQIPTLQPLAVSTLLSSFVAVTTIKRGTMNWARMIHHMLQSFMTVVGLKTLKLLAAEPVFMSRMTKTDVIVSNSYYLVLGNLLSYLSLFYHCICFQILHLYLVLL